MNVKRRWQLIVLSGLVMTSCFTAGIYAQDAIVQVQAYQRNDFNVVVNGQNVKLTNPPLIYNDNSYLPVKELSSYLGGVVNWKADTKTIYINSKINTLQEDDSEISYDQIKLMNFSAYYMNYLGGEYPVLFAYMEKVYYRERDMQKMGINTNGLRKTKDIVTEEIFISEDELGKRWKEKPQFNYTRSNYNSSSNSRDTYINNPAVIVGEKDPKKLEALKDYVNTSPAYSQDVKPVFVTPIIIDSLGQENEFTYLYMLNSILYRTHIKLTKFTDDIYLVGSSETVNLTSNADTKTLAP